jgi:hypothetical protein
MYSLQVIVVSILAASVAGRPWFNGTAWSNSTAHIEARRVNTTGLVEARSLNTTVALNGSTHEHVHRSVNVSEAVNSTSHVVIPRYLNSTAHVERRSWNATSVSNFTARVPVARY